MELRCRERQVLGRRRRWPRTTPAWTTSYSRRHLELTQPVSMTRQLARGRSRPERSSRNHRRRTAPDDHPPDRGRPGLLQRRAGRAVPGALVAGLRSREAASPNGEPARGGVRVEDYLFGIDDVTVRDNKIFRTEANSFGGGIAALGPASYRAEQQGDRERGQAPRRNRFGGRRRDLHRGGLRGGVDSLRSSTRRSRTTCHRQGRRNRNRRRCLRAGPVAIQRAEISRTEPTKGEA